MVTIVDHDCKITYHNPAVERILGHARADRIGRDAFELVHPDDLALVRAQWNASLRMYGSAARFEARFRHKDGSWCWFDVVGKNMLHNPAISGIVLVSNEASERLETRRRLKEYTTELEESTLQALADAVSGTSRGSRELLVAMAGELRTPVAGIVGFAELLLQTSLNSPQRECAERIRDSGAQLLKVFNQSVGEPAV
jgi:PAS domain S-box-containing protein